MSYDLYVALGGASQKDVTALVAGNYRNVQIPDIATRIRLLAGVVACSENLRDYAVSGDRKTGGGYKSLVHMANQPGNSLYAKDLMALNLDRLRSLGLLVDAPDLNALPPGSWFLQFTFTLAKPWMSKDDDPFYVTESVNPVRKDKVFKVPMMSAASWKGLLRWTAMHLCLVRQKDSLTPEQFAQERFRQTLLFGDEKGEEPGGTKDFAAFLDALRPEARAEYERRLRQHYGVQPGEPLPHHSGRLTFYPTFFNLIDVEVINPHSRRTKAGTHPIYLECVPIGAEGIFSLLYVPFDLIGQDEAEIRRQAAEDLRLVAEAIRAMMLTYGFSAKRTSGYGTAQERVNDGFVQIRIEAAQTPSASAPTATEPPLPKYLQAPGKLKDEYLNPDGTFRERSQVELAQMTKAQRQEYEKAKKWWEREGKALAGQPPAQAAAEAPAEAPKPTWPKHEFDSLGKLTEIAKALLEEQGSAQ
jgi:CRISPR-associated protein Cmr2